MIPSQPNPWGLTARECAALAALTKHASIPEAGEAIGVSYSQITNLIAQAKKRMKTKGVIHSVLEWDRWARTAEEPELEEGARMVLTDTVVNLIAQGIATNPDAMLPYCKPYSRQQVMTAVRNAAQKGRIHLTGRVSIDGVMGQRLGIYAIGPKPEKAEPIARAIARPVSSVWGLGAMA